MENDVTFKHKSPIIDFARSQNNKSLRKRRSNKGTKTNDQVAVLETEFKANPNWDSAKTLELSVRLGLKRS